MIIRLHGCKKIGTGFTESARDVGDFFVAFFVWFISSLPHIVVIAAIVCAVIFLIIRPIRKRKAKKKLQAPNAAASQTPAMQNPATQDPAAQDPATQGEKKSDVCPAGK